MKSFLKKSYEVFPFKRELLSSLRKFWHPSENIYKHLHFHGIFKVEVEKDAHFLMEHHGFHLENEVFWEGLERGHESISYSLWKPLAKNSKVIFDIGANTGVYSLIAQSINPSAAVFAFEPVKRIFHKLEKNKSINNFGIKSFEQALSNQNGDAVIYDTATEHIYSASVNKNMSITDDEIIPTKIETVRLDTLIEKYDLKSIDLMKIDVETHEPEVLEGMGKYLKEFKPNMLIEILNDEVGERVFELVKDNGYLYFNIDDKMKKLRQVDKISKSDFWNYLLCSPEKAKEIGLI